MRFSSIVDGSNIAVAVTLSRQHKGRYDIDCITACSSMSGRYEKEKIEGMTQSNRARAGFLATLDSP